jgi:predicted nucleic acid-binding protein
VARLILDTGVLVQAVRGRIDLAAFGAGDDVAVPAIALAEDLTGVELDADPARRAAQQAFVQELLSSCRSSSTRGRSRSTMRRCWLTYGASAVRMVHTT